MLPCCILPYKEEKLSLTTPKITRVGGRLHRCRSAQSPLSSLGLTSIFEAISYRKDVPPGAECLKNDRLPCLPSTSLAENPSFRRLGSTGQLVGGAVLLRKGAASGRPCSIHARVSCALTDAVTSRSSCQSLLAWVKTAFRPGSLQGTFWNKDLCFLTAAGSLSTDHRRQEQGLECSGAQRW